MAEIVFVSIFLALTFFVYGYNFYLLLKNRRAQAISMRSPNLLFLNNLGGFLMSCTYLLYEFMKCIYPDETSDKNSGFNIFCKILPNNYAVIHFLMILPYFLRYHRIIACCKIESDEHIQSNSFAGERYRYTEIYYIKILAILMFVVILISFILNYLINNYYIIPFYFDRCYFFINHDYSTSFPVYISFFWIFTNFAEHMALITYLYVLFHNGKVNDMIKLEYIIFTAIWYVYPNILRIFNLFDVKISDFWICIICIFFLYACLFVNGYLPLLYSYKNKEDIKYTFNSKLTENFFLFLSNEECVNSFLNYIYEIKDEKALYYFKVYIDIMKLKMKEKIVDNPQLVNLSKILFNNYFNVASSQYFNNEVLSKVKSYTEHLSIEEINYEMFDAGLVVAYEYLFVMYKEFKETVEYKILIDNLNLITYVQCKMCNTGLIKTL